MANNLWRYEKNLKNASVLYVSFYCKATNVKSRHKKKKERQRYCCYHIDMMRFERYWNCEDIFLSSVYLGIRLGRGPIHIAHFIFFFPHLPFSYSAFNKGFLSKLSSPIGRYDGDMMFKRGAIFERSEQLCCNSVLQLFYRVKTN